MGIELNNLYLRDEAQEWVPFKDWDMSKIINENADAEDEITVGEFFNNASPMNNYLPLSGGTLTGPVKSSNNNITKDNVPVSDIYTSNYIVSDSNDEQIGYVGAYQSTGGAEGINIGTSRIIDGNSEYNSINIGISPNGAKIVHFSDADTKAAWQNALNVPTAASTVKPVATAAVTGTATTYAREDHVHNITDTTITAALGFTPFNSASTLDITHGGTGLTAAPSMLVNLGSTAAASVLTASPRPGITGTLTVSHGGTGITAVSATNAVVIGNSSSTTGAMQTVAAANGAFYSTGANVKPIFGTLPIKQGGTGKTTATEAWTNLGGGSIGKLNTVSAANISSVSASVITGTLGITHGGTGKTTATEAWTYLGGGSIGKLNTVSATNISSVSASVITGTLGTDRIPNLDASKITTGIFAADRIPMNGPYFCGSAAGSPKYIKGAKQEGANPYYTHPDGTGWSVENIYCNGVLIRHAFGIIRWTGLAINHSYAANYTSDLLHSPLPMGARYILSIQYGLCLGGSTAWGFFGGPAGQASSWQGDPNSTIYDLPYYIMTSLGVSQSSATAYLPVSVYFISV